MSASSSPQPLRVVVVGCGPIGALHAETIQAHPAAEVVGLCAPSPTRRDPLAARLATRSFATLHDALEAVQSDCVSIASPDNAHYEQTLAALEAGRHVLCEKPLGQSLREAETIRTLAAERGLHVGVTFNRRYAFGYLEAKRLLDAGQVGEIRQIWLQATDGTPPARVATRPDAIFWTWLGHYLDMLRRLGGDVQRVAARLRSCRPDGLIEDVDLGVAFESGALGRLTAAYRAGQTRTVERCEIIGARGGVVVDDATRQVLTHQQDPDAVAVVQPNKYLTGDAFYESLRALIRDFFDRLSAGQAPPVSAEDAVWAARLSEAALQSHQQQKEVVLS